MVVPELKKRNRLQHNYNIKNTISQIREKQIQDLYHHIDKTLSDPK